jgi:acylphosphatase
MRFSAMHFAKEVGVNGFVQYNSLGEIIIEAEGGEEQLREFVRLCTECAASFVFPHVDVNECEKTGYTSFDIRHGLHDGGTHSIKPASPTLMKSFFTRARRVFSSGKNVVKADNQ